MGCPDRGFAPLRVTAVHLRFLRSLAVLSQACFLWLAGVDGATGADAAVDVCLPAGSLSLHDGLLIHGSNPNRSTRRRAFIAGHGCRPTAPV